MLLFLIYTEDLSEILIHNALPILFVDDTSVIVNDPNIVDFQFNTKVVFEQLNKWFNVNLFLLISEHMRFHLF